MSGLKECLEAYGADYAATMERFMGNEGLYLKIFDMFFQDENLNRLGAALKEEDYAAAFEAAHTLKGVAGNMGLAPFYDAVCALVEPLRIRERKDEYQALYQEIERQFQAVETLHRQIKGGKTA